MALDPEELKRQRQLRQQQRQARARQRRQLTIRLGIACAVLLLCGGLIFSLSRNSRQTPSVETTQPPVPETTTQTQTQPAVTEPTTTIHLVAGGDLNIVDTVVDAGGVQYDYTETFLDVAHLLADADLSVLNLEGSLYGPPYGTETRSAPQELMQALSRAGVDFIQLANSYSINKGLSGLTQTIDGVRAAGMEPLGVYADAAAFKAGKGYTLRNVNGITVALVAFTKGMDGMALPAGSEDCVNVLYEDYDSTYQDVDTKGITGILSAVAEEKPDITVALLHWGSEFNDTVSDSQQRIVKLLQANGVDAIIGTHSHYVQKLDYNPETGQIVAYSLGDFFGDAQRAGSEYSVLLDLEITRDNVSGDTKITGYSYTPIFTVSEKDAPAQVLRLEEAMAAYEANHLNRVSEDTYAAMGYALQRVAARVAGE